MQHSSSIATALGHKFYHTIGRSKVILVIIWINLVDLESPMLYTKIQPQSTGEEDFYVFLPYMGMGILILN